MAKLYLSSNNGFLLSNDAKIYGKSEDGKTIKINGNVVTSDMLAA
jgi:hypothetical protein